ncbi:MAG: RNA polymerase sigma factor [Actinomycetota bacterium]
MNAEPAVLENLNLAARAFEGDPRAGEDLIRATRDDVYNLAMRMLGHPADAEDATQEILVKVVTRLGSFRGGSGLRTWVWRVAADHLLSAKRGRGEPEHVSFEGWRSTDPGGRGQARLHADDAGMPRPGAAPGLHPRRHIDLTGEEGGRVLGIEPAAFRKRLSRARGRMRTFMERTCGLVSEEAGCRCALQIGRSVHSGLLDRAGSSTPPIRSAR